MADHFADRLCEAVKTKKTSLVVGLDPVYNRLPAIIRSHRQMNDEFLGVPFYQRRILHKKLHGMRPLRYRYGRQIGYFLESYVVFRRSAQVETSEQHERPGYDQ